MDGLNNNQIILLGILVSFVTSIATGIVTVSLMQEAPVSVTQTINRVVERTVEKVIPGETKTVVQEVSKVINVEDLVVEAVKKSSPAVVTLYSEISTSTKPGFLMENGKYLVSVGGSAGENFVLKKGENETINLKFLVSDSGTGISIYQPLLPAGGKEVLPSIALSFSGISPGQSSIALGSSAEGDKTLSVGIISNVSGNASSTLIIRSQAIVSSTIGGPLIDIHGMVIGVNIKEREAVGAWKIKMLIDSL